MFMGVLRIIDNAFGMLKILLASALAGLSVTMGPSSSPNPMPQVWQLPFQSPHRLIRAYLQPTSDYSAGHRGVDYAVAADESVFAPASGVISVAGTIVDRGVIVIAHEGSLISELEPVCSTLKVGDQVVKGALIGRFCQTNVDYRNHCEVKPCLHFSLRLNGKYLSPIALIGGLTPSRLLP
jgi:murein DD-endopeptidase MepM/ murein hydrolase activator NlpD